MKKLILIKYITLFILILVYYAFLLHLIIDEWFVLCLLSVIPTSILISYLFRKMELEIKEQKKIDDFINYIEEIRKELNNIKQ